MKKISIVIPALNESDGIAKTIQCVPKQELEGLGYSVQILVVDNGSTDETGEIARKCGAEVIFEAKRGYGYAYKAGFTHAEGVIIVTADADLTYPLGDTPSLVKTLEDENLDFITTNRFVFMDKSAMSFRNKVGNIILTLMTRILFGIRINDSQSGMWIFKRDILDKLLLRSNGMALSEELKLEACYFAKCAWKELPIRYRARLGEVKLRVWRDGIENLFFLFRKRIYR